MQATFWKRFFTEFTNDGRACARANRALHILNLISELHLLAAGEERLAVAQDLSIQCVWNVFPAIWLI